MPKYDFSRCHDRSPCGVGWLTGVVSLVDDGLFAYPTLIVKWRQDGATAARALAVSNDSEIGASTYSFRNMHARSADLRKSRETLLNRRCKRASSRYRKSVSRRSPPNSCDRRSMSLTLRTIVGAVGALESNVVVSLMRVELFVGRKFRSAWSTPMDDLSACSIQVTVGQSFNTR